MPRLAQPVYLRAIGNGQLLVRWTDLGRHIDLSRPVNCAPTGRPGSHVDVTADPTEAP